VTKRLRGTGLISVAAALTLTMAACGGSGDPSTESTSSGEAIRGEVKLDGSSTVFPIAEAAAELFEERYPDAIVSVGTSGTGGGFEKFCQGEIDISNASRPVNDREKAACAENDITFAEITVGIDALTVLVHPDNPVDCLTIGQLAEIYGPDSTITNWNQITGIDFDVELVVYGPGEDSGTFAYFTEAINGEEGQIRGAGYNNIGENDNSGLQGVQGALGGIFYVGYTYYAENQGSVKALQIDGGDGCVAPTPENARNGSYAPLSRGLYMYPSGASLAKPQVRAFLEFVINENEAITSAVSAIGLTQAQKTEMLGLIDSLAS
jgi:phosphate transport system substrate-binding protein